MPTNQYFNQFDNTDEQSLLDSLAVEVIQIHGININYIPRTLVSYDELLGEDALSTYDTSYEIEMYIKSYDGFEGDGEFLSMHGLEIRHQVTLSCAVTTFHNLVDPVNRPKEGSIVHFPLDDGIFVIKYVNSRPIFYAMGALQVYDLVCERFEYSGERFNTGIAVVDALEGTHSTDVVADPLMDLDTTPSDIFSDNEVFESEGDEFIFDENNPFGDP